jgi:predicted MPP superfamily phosphohydrolase
VNDVSTAPSAISGADSLRVERIRQGRWLQLPPPGGFARTRLTVLIESLPASLRGFRIVHLSDFHIRRRWCAAYDELCALLRDDPPDLILMTGDYVEHRRLRAHEVELARRLIDNLSARLGIFGIFGNHDGDFLACQLKSQKLQVIENRQVRLDMGRGGALELVGFPGVSRDDLEEEFLARIGSASAPSSVRIVLAHYPDQLRHAQRIKADIMLAGHTHGGQICLPGGVPLMTHDSLPRRFASGAHLVGRTWLIVSRGFGYAGLPLRLFCPGEFVEIVLERQAPVVGG